MTGVICWLSHILHLPNVDVVLVCCKSGVVMVEQGMLVEVFCLRLFRSLIFVVDCELLLPIYVI